MIVNVFSVEKTVDGKKELECNKKLHKCDLIWFNGVGVSGCGCEDNGHFEISKGISDLQKEELLEAGITSSGSSGFRSGSSSWVSSSSGTKERKVETITENGVTTEYIWENGVLSNQTST